jgi:hypothetical protein
MNEEGELFAPIDECEEESEGPQDAADLEVGFVEVEAMPAAGGYLENKNAGEIKLKDMLGTSNERRNLRDLMGSSNNGQQLKLNPFAI